MHFIACAATVWERKRTRTCLLSRTMLVCLLVSDIGNRQNYRGNQRFSLHCESSSGHQHTVHGHSSASAAKRKSGKSVGFPDRSRSWVHARIRGGSVGRGINR